MHNWKLEFTNMNPLFLVAINECHFAVTEYKKSFHGPYLNLRGANIETDLHFLFQTIWLALRKSKQPTFHVYLPTDSIKIAWHKHPNILTWVTRTHFRMKWIWMLPHKRQLVKKAPQMVRDEWTKAHFIGRQKNKMAKCVFAAVQSCV